MPKPTGAVARANYAQVNQSCARIIAVDPARYGGEGSLMVQWAREMLKCEEQCKTVEIVDTEAGKAN